jgi:zinc/manganese transport system substrate-binding protein
MRRSLAALAAIVVVLASVMAPAPVPAARAQDGENQAGENQAGENHDGENRAGQSADTAGGNRLSVVASFSILRDLAAHVGRDRIDVTALVGPGGDAHVYEPSPADARMTAAAGLIVVNGLGFEGWMERLAQASAIRAPVVVASAGVAPRHAGHHDGAAHAAGPDPHAWQSVRNAEIYVANIRDGLVRADPQGRAAYEANAAAYLAELGRLDADIRRAVTAIPPARRKVITTHEAFGYFAAEYGVAFIAAQGVSSETDPPARDIARIIRAVREQNIPALFFENAADPRLIRRIAAETGARIGGTLYADTLSPDAGPAATYVDMMRHNIREIMEGLK